MKKMKLEIRNWKYKLFCVPLRKLSAFSAVFLLCFFANAQIKLDEIQTKINLKKHISTLASDKFLGRETGTEGETLSLKYIIREFKSVGLLPMGEHETFIQAFDFIDGMKYGENNSLTIGDKKYRIDENYYPLPYSSSSGINSKLLDFGFGISADSIQYNDYKNIAEANLKIFVMEIGTPDGNTPHSKLGAFSDIRQKIDTAIAKGASAVVFVNSDTTTENPKKHDFTMKITQSSVPVVFFTGTKTELFSGNTSPRANIRTDLEKINRTGHNIIGYIDNHCSSTVVIGAHYDHLGMGEEYSLYRGKPEIHNGADDNASGTSAIIEIARYLKSSSVSGQKNNYLIIAFSGEEKGLYGSALFTKNPTVPLPEINYMINLDMVGRMKEDKMLAVNGVGTSPDWTPVLYSISVDGIKMKTSESGIGPSDHTSFYLKDIPVLHFFSGTHSDYHKPSDDEDKINYDGEISIIKIILSVIENENTKGRLLFTKTKEEKNEDTPRFKVTLGVVPDYMFEGEGMRIEGVTDGKPASKAGLLAGDIVVALGENKVTDMMSYMKGLSKFQKGDETIVKVIRGKETVEKRIQFQFLMKNSDLPKAKKYSQVLPDLEDWPIVQLSKDRAVLAKEVESESIRKIKSVVNGNLEDTLARTLFLESLRIREQRWSTDPHDENDFWKNVKEKLLLLSQKPKNEAQIDEEKLLHEIVSRYTNEISGKFSIRAYQWAQRVLNIVFYPLLNAPAYLNFLEKKYFLQVQKRIHLSGEIESLRVLAKNHTLVLVPTHFSNLDSVTVGWAARSLGLPAFLYGAGLNLFGIKMFSFFMNRIGAYKVDRRKKNPLYLETLKTYSTLALHRGCHTMFFPYGDRSLSGSIEKKLKLGLLGTTLDAQYMNLKNASEKNPAKKIIIVPVVLNYHFVLEAPFLIDEYLPSAYRKRKLY